MEKVVIYSDLSLLVLGELIDVPYEKQYFGFKENAIDYMMRIVDFVDGYVDYPISKASPTNYQKFGKSF